VTQNLTKTNAIRPLPGLAPIAVGDEFIDKLAEDVIDLSKLSEVTV